MEPTIETSADLDGQAKPRISWQIRVPEWSMSSVAWLLVNVSAVLRSAGAGVKPPGMTLSVRRLDRSPAQESM